MHPSQIHNQLGAFHRRLGAVEAAAAKQAADIQNNLQQWSLAQQIRQAQSGIGDQFSIIPGRRIPWSERIEIEYEYQDNKVGEGSVTIPIDGSAVFEHVAAFWRPTDTDDSHYSDSTASNWIGWAMPISAYQAFSRSAPSGTGTGPNMSALVDIVELDLQFISASTGKNWSNLPVSGALFDQIDKHPLVPYGYANSQEAFTVRGQTRRNIPHEGTLEVIFYGYQILGVLNLTEALNQAMKGMGSAPGIPNMHP